MGKHFFDFEDGDFAFSISDNMAMDSDGDLMMRMGNNSAAYGTKVNRWQTPRPHACLHAAGGTVVAFGRHAGTVCLSAEGDPGWYRDLRAFGSVFSVPAPQVFLREDVYAFTYAGKGFVCRI